MSPNEPRSVFTAAQRGRSQLKCNPLPSRPGKRPPCPAPEHPQLITPVCPGRLPGPATVGDGDGGGGPQEEWPWPGQPWGDGAGLRPSKETALGAKPVQGRWGWREELVSLGEGQVTGCPQHWLSQCSCPSGHGHSCPLATGCPVPWTVGSPSPGHKVSCPHIHGLSCPLGTLSPGQSCPHGPQAPSSPGGRHPTFCPVGTPPTSSHPADNSLRAVGSIPPPPQPQPPPLSPLCPKQ